MAEILTKVRLRFSKEGLSRSRWGTLYGRVYFEVDGEAFPERDWSDLLVAFAASWLETLVQIASLEISKDKAPFFDGPLAVDIFRRSDGLASLNFIHKDLVKHTAIARVEDLLRDAISTSRSILTMCRSHNWSSDPDTQQLQVMVRRGEEVLTLLGPRA